MYLHYPEDDFYKNSKLICFVLVEGLFIFMCSEQEMPQDAYLLQWKTNSFAPL